MTAQQNCNVRGCDREVAADFSFTWRATRRDYRVCDGHKLILDAGESYDTSADKSELVLGHDIEPDLIDVELRWGIGQVPTFRLTLGHDGFEEKRITFRIESDEGRALAHYVETHPGLGNG